MLKSPERACHLAKHAFDEAVQSLDSEDEGPLHGQNLRDALMILQLLRDDLILWFSEVENGLSFNMHLGV